MLAKHSIISFDVLLTERLSPLQASRLSWQWCITASLHWRARLIQKNRLPVKSKWCPTLPLLARIRTKFNDVLFFPLEIINHDMSVLCSYRTIHWRFNCDKPFEKAFRLKTISLFLRTQEIVQFPLNERFLNQSAWARVPVCSVHIQEVECSWQCTVLTVLNRPCAQAMCIVHASVGAC